MLTFVLLAVLAGAVGVIAVSSAERGSDTATPVRERGRARSDDEPASPSPALPASPTGADEVVGHPAATSPPIATQGIQETPPEPTHVAERPRVAPDAVASEARRRRRPGRREIAVEGAYAVVARRSLLRRLRAAVSISVLSVALGVTIAALVGLSAVLVGELLSRAIG